MTFDFKNIVKVSFLLLYLFTSSALLADMNGNKAALFQFDSSEDESTLADTLKAELADAGYAVKKLDVGGLCDLKRLSAENFDLLVLPNASTLPLKSRISIEHFLKEGGNIIALRAPLWQKALVEINGQWVTYEQYQFDKADILPSDVIVDLKHSEVLNWEIDSNNKNAPVLHEFVKDNSAPGGLALHVTMLKFDSSEHEFYAYLMSPKIQKSIPNNHDLIIFSAKGGINTPELVVTLADEDNVSWSKVIPLYPEWRQYVLCGKDFKGPEKKQLKLESIRQLKLGQMSGKTGYNTEKCDFWIGPIGKQR